MADNAITQQEKQPQQEQPQQPEQQEHKQEEHKQDDPQQQQPQNQEQEQEQAQTAESSSENATSEDYGPDEALREGKAKLYRRNDEQEDWQEIGIGYAACERAVGGTFHIALHPLEDADGPAWRQPVDDAASYMRDDLIIQWHTDARCSKRFDDDDGDSDSDDDDNEADDGDDEGDAAFSYALSFLTDAGCTRVMQQIEDSLTDQSSSFFGSGGTDDSNFQMPPASVENIPSIEAVLKSCNSHIKKHAVSTSLDKSTYIDDLLNLLPELENAGDAQNIDILFNIVKMIVGLNERDHLEKLLQDQNYKKFFGLMGYDPDEPDSKVVHREFLDKQMRYISVIPVQDSLQQLIHYTFRLGYLRDTHPGYFQEVMGGRLSHLINLNNVKIIRQLGASDESMGLILKAIREPDTVSCSRVQAMTLLFEFCDMAAKNPFMTTAEQSALFSNLCKNPNFFETIRVTLQCPASPASPCRSGEAQAVRALSARILRRVLDVEQTLCREFLSERDPQPENVPPLADLDACDAFLRDRKAEHSLFLCVIRLVVDEDCLGIQADGVDILRAILDPQHVATISVNSAFEEFFYNNYMRWLIHPFQKLATVSDEELANESVASKHAKSLICEFCSFCVASHGFRFKYFTIKHKVLSQIVEMCRYPDKHLRLAAIRLFRNCISVKDNFFPRVIVKNDLLRPIFKVLRANGSRRTMTQSTISAFLQQIAAVPIKPLVTHIVQKYSADLALLPSKDLIEQLKDQHEKLSFESSGRNGAGGGGAGAGLDRNQAAWQDQKRHREAMSDESYFDYSDDSDDEQVTASSDAGSSTGNGAAPQVNGAGADASSSPTATGKRRSNSLQVHPESPSNAASVAQNSGENAADDESDIRNDPSASVKKARLDQSP